MTRLPLPHDSEARLEMLRDALERHESEHNRDHDLEDAEDDDSSMGHSPT